ncbi:adenosine deaminase [Cutibacterium sp. WCA-380-WT-3A]|uniref:adenosine deaminase n=1 Tax=Cutibacterium porci TaxID=2605781 RepID=A0A7K0J407_9ACTN|nr:adenosine deaminase [Cutibacterium porci]MSS44578.1 adenosine deaminase [Cutibacterium porci]
MDLVDAMNLPKVVLHDHLDGGLRPATVVELAAQRGRVLPAHTPKDLADWFFESANSGSLVRYLDTFVETVSLMQDADSLRRIAREFVVDMAADGVIYAETRWAPQQHLAGGLTAAAATEAVQAGLVEGMESASRSGKTIIVRQILCLMRHLDVPEDVVDLAVNHAPGVVGVDIAGPEDGFPLAPFSESLARIQAAGIHVTAHAGEAAGPESILDALNHGAERLGHGVRIIEDRDDTGWGPTAQRVLSDHVPLEVCPTSNTQTGICRTVAEHPLSTLWPAGFNITVSCDNRLMSRTTTSREISLVSQALNWGRNDALTIQRNALQAAFCSREDKRTLIPLLV